MYNTEQKTQGEMKLWWHLLSSAPDFFLPTLCLRLLVEQAIQGAFQSAAYKKPAGGCVWFYEANISCVRE